MRPRAWVSACVAAGIAALAPVVAPAADVPPPQPYPQAPAPIAVRAPYSWYGFYIGIQGGYGFGGRAIAYTPNASYAALFASGAVPTGVADDPAGFVGGITYGSNYQFGSLVIGTESDWSFSDIRKRETLGPLAGFTTQVTAEQRLKYFSTSRGRLGFLAAEHWLIYGTGGLASGRVESNTAFNLVAPGACAGAGNCPAGDRSKTLWGWTAGGGMEIAYGPWSMKAEYLYYDLGTLNYTVADPTLPAGAITASSKFSGSLVRGGISYRFNWTPLDLILGRGPL
jgi:outer membrane immunogenic protein